VIGGMLRGRRLRLCRLRLGRLRKTGGGRRRSNQKCPARFIMLCHDCLLDTTRRCPARRNAFLRDSKAYSIFYLLDLLPDKAPRHGTQQGSMAMVDARKASLYFFFLSEEQIPKS
jgi:hypothetical protein